VTICPEQQSRKPFFSADRNRPDRGGEQESMGQAILGLSIFLGLQIGLFLVLFGVTLWERRQLDRPIGGTRPPLERVTDR
jgi:hypothetical protein